MPKPKDNKRIATLDIETDPFLYGRTPMPFAIGFYDGETYTDFWGDDCVEKMMEFLAEAPEDYRIYVHNGGGFDFWFLEDGITNPVFFINKRIAKCGFLDRHEMRDSYRMIPIPLAKFNKTVIDYAIMEEKVREKHKAEILSYLRDDCHDLYNMVTDFIARYGMSLTMGGAALKHLKKEHPNKSETQYFDAIFRPYYVGGRCEYFETGRIEGPLEMHDINSLYPDRMRNAYHPRGNSYLRLSALPPDDDERIYFARIVAESKGALPVRKISSTGFVQGLHFPHGVHEFYACSHEIKVARSLGLLKVLEVKECRVFEDYQKFDTYIDKFMDEKIKAEEAGDKGGREFAKLFMNTPYGKFGQDPSKYRDCEIFDSIEECVEAGFKPAGEISERYIGEKQAELKPWSFNNVSIAASITSAARAVLLFAIVHSIRPVYCDTDSLVCEKLNQESHPTKLGAWKHEATFDEFFIAGKKLYAGFQDGKCIKKASKGVNLAPELIAKIAVEDVAINVPIDAPTLRIGSEAKFIERIIRRTY